MCCDPEIGDGRIPGARDCAERRQEKVIECAEEDVREEERCSDENNVVGEPRWVEGGGRRHCVYNLTRT